MPQPVTKYAEIQQDEIDALRSIYMDDFEEQEAKVGAWNVGGPPLLPFLLFFHELYDPSISVVLPMSQILPPVGI